ncbi:MAG: hypothetical protein PHP06_05900 [Clostridia bacterium]|nr:hypothetical protein [Clostridia bacterium]
MKRHGSPSGVRSMAKKKQDMTCRATEERMANLDKAICNLDQDENGICSHLWGESCGVPCCKGCRNPNCNSRCKNSVQPGNSSCDQRQDRSDAHKIIVIDGLRVIQLMDSEYGIEHMTWERACAEIRKRFRQKTSRSIKNGTEYESTRWYQMLPGGGMKSTGSAEEPDYKKFYSPEPEPRYRFPVWISEHCLHTDEHIIVDEKDYRDNEKLFKDCLVFELDDNLNYLHPLYKNPNKNLSVRVPLSAGHTGMDRKETRCDDKTANADPEDFDDPEFPGEEDSEEDL